MTHPLYFIEIAGLKIRGKWFLECDRDETRSDVLDTVRLYGEQVLKVLEVYEAEGSCRDVTEEFKHCAKWGDHELSDPLPAQFDHRRDELKHGAVG